MFCAEYKIYIHFTFYVGKVKIIEQYNVVIKTCYNSL